MPTFAHLPVITDMKGKKLSKRFESVTIEAYRKEGYLSEAVINAVALLGWSAPAHDDPSNADLSPKEFIKKEMYSMADLEKFFTLEKVSRRSSKFDKDKFLFFNSQFINQKFEYSNNSEKADRTEKFRSLLIEYMPDLNVSISEFSESKLTKIMDLMVPRL